MRWWMLQFRSWWSEKNDRKYVW